MLNFFLYPDHKEKYEGHGVPHAAPGKEEKYHIKNEKTTICGEENVEREISAMNEGCEEHNGLRARDCVENNGEEQTIDQEGGEDYKDFLDGPNKFPPQ